MKTYYTVSENTAYRMKRLPYIASKMSKGKPFNLLHNHLLDFAQKASSMGNRTLSRMFMLEWCRIVKIMPVHVSHPERLQLERGAQS